MKKTQEPVTDLVSSRAGSRTTVSDRIETRLGILKLWLADGIPPDKELPRSLKAVRLWEDQSLGISAIHSPNDFTTTNPTHGTKVKLISELLSKITSKGEFRKQPSKVTQPKSANHFDRKTFDQQLEAVVSQWHSERHHRLREQKRADSAEARNIILTEELNQKNQIISDLQRKITGKNGPRIVK